MALFLSFGHILGRRCADNSLKITVEGGIVLIPRKAGKRGKRHLAALAGYEDYTTFYRNFTRIVGTSPLEYEERKKSRP